MPKVSVIIITYNRADLLKKAINSVLGQTFTDFEVVVVDDASTDNTEEVVQTCDYGHIKYIRHKNNAGPSRAKNTGIRNSTGEYIAFLDDDDEWLPEKLQKQVTLLDDSPTTVGVVYTGFLKMDRNTGKPIQQVVPSKRGRICYEMALQNWIGTSTVIVRKRCFDKVGLFDESLGFGEDYDMWIRISKEYQFDYIREPLVHYMVHDGSMSANYALICRGMEVSNKKHAEFFASNKKAFSERYYVLGIFYCLSGDTVSGRKALVRAIRLDPLDLRYYFRFCASILGAANFATINSWKERIALWLKKGFSIQ